MTSRPRNQRAVRVYHSWEPFSVTSQIDKCLVCDLLRKNGAYATYGRQNPANGSVVWCTQGETCTVPPLDMSTLDYIQAQLKTVDYTWDGNTIQAEIQTIFERCFDIERRRKERPTSRGRS